ncbi:MAG TPA: SDR family oxidoreductase [Fimbriimonas sp.]|nr:SDR family oxidoreductase [Fimbriimonas sp.]
MQVLVTGNLGYIGTVLTPLLAQHGHNVVGLDTGFFEECLLVPLPSTGVSKQIYKDTRDVTVSDLEGCDAVVHLAAISNDPMGELSPEITLAINYGASVGVAELAKRAGVQRFVFASSCSIYGQSDQAALTEECPFNPQTSYALSKVKAEAAISDLASDRFSPIYMRNATVYGYSPRLRFDLAINNLTGYGYTTGHVRLNSDGKAWRPFIHVHDLCQAALQLLEAPAESVHNQAFNIGSNDQNFQIRDVAEQIAAAVPGWQVSFGENLTADTRNYNVSFDKLGRLLPDFRPTYDVPKAVAELIKAFDMAGLDTEALQSKEFTRLKQIQYLLAKGEVGADLRRSRLAQSA